MSSTEEPDKPYSLSQPLLSEPYPPPSSVEDPAPRDHSTDPPPDQNRYLQISYNYGPRPIRDLPFLILFILFVLATFAFGIFASVNRNPNSSDVSSFIYDFNSTSCIKKSSSSLAVDRRLFEDSLSLYSSSSSLLKNLIWTLVITLILSAPLAFFVLLLLKHYTKQIVYVSLPFFVVVPFFLNVYWFVACTVSDNCSDAFPLVYRILVLVFVFLVIGVTVWIFVVNWHRIELTVRVIGVASSALLNNLGLFVVLPALTLGLVVYYVPIVVFLVLSRQNGKIVVGEKSGEYYCSWKQDGWVPVYYALAILTMLWSAATMREGQVYVISGRIAQWYFSKDDQTPRRSMRNSLRNAFGPSSGTVCFSGLLIFVVRVVRAAVDAARREDAVGIVNLVLRCCVNTLLSAIEFLNKFTITFAAITGEAYCTSARMTYELLKRNLLSTVFVEIVSTRILAGIIFVLSAIYAIVVFAILKAIGDLGAESYFVAAMACVLLIAVLSLFVHLLDTVIDTVYVCFAIDRDREQVCKQNVHEVYVQLHISRNHRSFPATRTPIDV